MVTDHLRTRLLYLCFQDWGQMWTHIRSARYKVENIKALIASPISTTINSHSNLFSKKAARHMRTHEDTLTVCTGVEMPYLALFDCVGHRLSTACLQTTVNQRLESQLVTVIWCRLLKTKWFALNRKSWMRTLFQECNVLIWTVWLRPLLVRAEAWLSLALLDFEGLKMTWQVPPPLWRTNSLAECIAYPSNCVKVGPKKCTNKKQTERPPE